MTQVKDKERIRKSQKDRVENRKWIVGFLEQKNDPNLSEAIFKYKMSVKIFMLELSGRDFRNVYPEMNSYFLTSDKIPFYARARYFIIIYFYPLNPIISWLVQSIKRFLRSEMIMWCTARFIKKKA